MRESAKLKGFSVSLGISIMITQVLQWEIKHFTTGGNAKIKHISVMI